MQLNQNKKSKEEMKKDSKSKTKKNNVDEREDKKDNPGVRNINCIKIEPPLFLRCVDLKNNDRNKNKYKIKIKIKFVSIL